jgi:hypothetical protein
MRAPVEIIAELVATHPGASQNELIRLAKPQGIGERRLAETLTQAVLEKRLDARRGASKTLQYYLPPDAGVPRLQ